MTITPCSTIVAGLFPAFGIRLAGADRQFIDEHQMIIDRLLEGSQRLLPGGCQRLAEHLAGGVEHELRAQAATYLVSCAAADRVREVGGVMGTAAGYSMGLYAALYAAGAVDFVTGLHLIEEAHALVAQHVETARYGNGVIVGLSTDDVGALMAGDANLEITNRNNPHSIIVTGPRESVIDLIGAARSEGALAARLLPFNVPYHHSVLAGAAGDFAAIVERCSIAEPRCPLVSAIDQRLIVGSSDLGRELVNNISTPLDWHRTMNALLEMDIACCVECGPGTSLEKFSRFLHRPCIVVTLDRIDTIPRFCGTGETIAALP